ncbi:MAG: GntR family transcriptional regulator [Psychrilyobacter sp.]|nr:GntR family transcriptional regulator [Psychrilyobacter sp.]
MEFKKNIPIYLQIIDSIKKDISLGNLNPGEKLLSTRDFAIKLKVNPNTISRVYKDLEAEKIAFTKRGLGTFVTLDTDILNKIQNNMVKGLVERFISDISVLGVSVDEAVKLLTTQEELNGKPNY